MALVLSLDVTANTGKARVELDNLEGSLKRVEQAADRVTSAAAKAESPVAKVAQALSGQNQAVDKVVRSSQALEEATRKLSAAKGDWNKLTTDEFMLLSQSKRLTDDLKQQLGDLRGAHERSTVAVGGFRSALASLGAYINPTTAAIAALGTVVIGTGIAVGASAKHYFDHADATKASRDALAGLSDAWGDFKMEVGRAALGDDFSIVKPVRMFESALDSAAGALSRVLEGTREWFGELLRGSTMWGNIRTGGFGFALAELFTADRFERMPTSGFMAPDFEGATFTPAQLAAMERDEAQRRRRMAEREAMEYNREQQELQRDRERQAREALQLQRFLAGVRGEAIPMLPLTGAALFGGLDRAFGSIDMDYVNARWALDNYRDLPSVPVVTGFGRYNNGLWPSAGDIPGTPVGLPTIPAGVGIGNWGQQVLSNVSAVGPYQMRNTSGQITTTAQWLNLASFGGQTIDALGFGDTKVGRDVSDTLSLMGTGAMIGSVVPGIGTAVGAGIGAAIGGIKALASAFGATDYEKREREAARLLPQMTGAVEAQFGGLEGASFLAERLGINWGDVRTWRGGGSVSPVANIVEQISNGATGALNDILNAALTTGTEFPAALQPALESLIRMGGLTTENANLLRGLPAAGVPSMQEISEAAKVLGVDVGALGDQVKQIGLSETAEQAAQAWLTLERAGADMSVVAAASAQQMQGYVDQALKYGFTLPESLKPAIDKMHELGLISGDVKDIKWAKPITDSVADLIQALKDLVNEMRGDVTGAMNDLDGKEINVAVNYRTNGSPYPVDPTGPPSPDSEAVAHSGGYLWNGRVYPYQTLHTGGLAGDEFFIRAQSGEFMMQRSAVQRFGVGFMQAVNSGHLPARHVTIPVKVVMADDTVVAEAVARATLQ